MKLANFLSETGKFALEKLSFYPPEPSVTMNFNLCPGPTLPITPVELKQNVVRTPVADHDLAVLVHV